MIKNFLKILYLLINKKISFKSPKRCDLVIFDIKSFNDIKYFFEKFDYFILESRLDTLKKIYLSPKVIFYIIKNLSVGNIFTIYMISLLEIVKPKIIFTRIDNSLKFSELAKLCSKKYKFMALQSAVRMDYLYDSHFYKMKEVNFDYNKQIFIPYFFCFGDYEKEKFREINLRINNFFPVGDLQFSDYLQFKKKNPKKNKKKDICLITDYIGKNYNHAYYGYDKLIYEKLNDSGHIRNINFKEGTLKLLRYVLRFVQKNNLSLAIPLKRDPKLHPHLAKIEKEYFKNNLNKQEYEYFEKCVIERDRFNCSSLTSLMNSNVAVGLGSTLLRNKIGAGGKALSCNFVKDEIYNFPIDGVCSLKDCEYEDFERRMLELLKMPETEFHSKIDKNPGYIMKFQNDLSTEDMIIKKFSEFGVNIKK